MKSVPQLANYIKMPLPILNGSLSRIIPCNNEYSKFSISKFMDEYPPVVFEVFPPGYRPLSELESLSKLKKQFFIATGGTARGKTEAIQLFCRNYMHKWGGLVLSLVPSQIVGEEQKRKFSKMRKKLQDPLLKCVTYYHGPKKKNQYIREQSLSHTFLITSPLMYIGSLIHYSSMTSVKQEEFLKKVKENLKDPTVWDNAFSTDNFKWSRELMSPSIVFIDEVDSFPAHIMQCLAMIVKLLIARNPNLIVILASGTIGNPDHLASLFFGSKAEYELLPGKGRRGKTNVNVYAEESPNQLLHCSIQRVKIAIQGELPKIRPGKRSKGYTPLKIIFLINNKTDIDIREIIGEFDEYFETIHGDMPADIKAEKLKKFRTEPLKMCLVATDIVQASLDLPDLNWIIMYGLPASERVYLQRRGRCTRNPDNHGNIDIILRASNANEQELSQPANKDKLKKYVFRETPPSLITPLYTPKTLQYGIALGAIFGIWNIRENLKEFVSDDHPYYHQDLTRAYLTLLRTNVVGLAPYNEIRPTSGTKKWFFDFNENFDVELYKVILKRPSGKEIHLGRISYVRLLRHGLPTQILPFYGKNLHVREIDRENREVITTVGKQPLHYYRNKIKTKFSIPTLNAIIAKDDNSHIVLVEVAKEIYVEKADRRSEQKIEDLKGYSHLIAFSGVFLPTQLTLEVFNTIKEACNSLNIDFSLFKIITDFSNEQFSVINGTLLIDTSNLGLAQHLYMYLLDEVPEGINGEKLKEDQPIGVSI